MGVLCHTRRQPGAFTKSGSGTRPTCPSVHRFIKHGELRTPYHNKHLQSDPWLHTSNTHWNPSRPTRWPLCTLPQTLQSDHRNSQTPLPHCMDSFRPSNIQDVHSRGSIRCTLYHEHIRSHPTRYAVRNLLRRILSYLPEYSTRRKISEGPFH